MKYLISYRQQLKITPAPPPAAAGLAFVSGVVVVGRGASRPSAQSFAAPRVCTTQKAPLSWQKDHAASSNVLQARQPANLLLAFCLISMAFSLSRL
jgi:hypothetical protein